MLTVSKGLLTKVQMPNHNKRPVAGKFFSLQLASVYWLVTLYCQFSLAFNQAAL